MKPIFSTIAFFVISLQTSVSKPSEQSGYYYIVDSKPIQEFDQELKLVDYDEDSASLIADLFDPYKNEQPTQVLDAEIYATSPETTTIELDTTEAPETTTAQEITTTSPTEATTWPSSTTTSPEVDLCLRNDSYYFEHEIVSCALASDDIIQSYCHNYEQNPDATFIGTFRWQLDEADNCWGFNQCIKFCLAQDWKVCQFKCQEEGNKKFKFEPRKEECVLSYDNQCYP